MPRRGPPADRWRRWLQECMGSSWTCRAGGSTPRSPACARRWRSSSASIRSAGCRKCSAWAQPSTTIAESRTTRSRASCARNSVSEQTAFDGYVTHFGHVFRASLHARNGRLAEAELALSRSSARLPGWFAGDADVTRAAIAAGRGDYDALERAIESAARVPWTPRVHATALLIPVLVEAGRRDRARDVVDEALAARPALASGARLLALRAWLRSLDGDEAGRARRRQRAPGRTRATALSISCAASARGSSRCCGRRSSAVSWRRRASSKRWMPPCPVVPPRWP